MLASRNNAPLGAGNAWELMRIDKKIKCEMSLFKEL
jgi:hypothetical protein